MLLNKINFTTLIILEGELALTKQKYMKVCGII